MNKLKSIIVGGLCAMSLNASVDYGITQSTLGNAEAGYGFSYGVKSLFYKPEKFESVGIGLGIDMMYFTLGEMKGLDDDACMVVDIDLLAGYSFEKQGAPMRLIAGVGYGIGQIGSTYYDGLTYQGGMEYDFSETKGVGFRYRYNNADLIIAGAKTEIKNYVVYFKYSSK